MSRTERQILSNFSDYIHVNRTKDNPNIEVVSTDKPSHEYLILKLNNIRKITKEFHEMIEQFQDGTKFNVSENSEANTYIHTVCIPLERHEHGHHNKHDNNRQSKYERYVDKSKPNIVNLMSAVIILMVTVGLGAYVTTSSDWWGIF